ncbi:hypothetical protein Hypma_004860 [Hypsizygus marmoreus]|uniref:Uncharacterized protein n=1 Tax=Hypsizygus marmoreus TaxID=39966 RepID=A0A369J1Z5_HYPMA|nr:hypothetical protein Hypma_004860 [Hypsizygus marmoreus]
MLHLQVQVDEDEPKSNKSGKRRIHGMVAGNISIACLHCHPGSRYLSITTFQLMLAHIGTCSLLDTLDDIQEQQEVAELIAWWNKKIFPHTSPQSVLAPVHGSALERNLCLWWILEEVRINIKDGASSGQKSRAGVTTRRRDTRGEARTAAHADEDRWNEEPVGAGVTWEQDDAKKTHQDAQRQAETAPTTKSGEREPRRQQHKNPEARNEEQNTQKGPASQETETVTTQEETQAERRTRNTPRSELTTSRRTTTRRPRHHQTHQRTPHAQIGKKGQARAPPPGKSSATNTEDRADDGSDDDRRTPSTKRATPESRDRQKARTRHAQTHAHDPKKRQRKLDARKPEPHQETKARAEQTQSRNAPPQKLSRGPAASRRDHKTAKQIPPSNKRERERASPGTTDRPHHSTGKQQPRQNQRARENNTAQAAPARPPRRAHRDTTDSRQARNAQKRATHMNHEQPGPASTNPGGAPAHHKTDRKRESTQTTQRPTQPHPSQAGTEQAKHPRHKTQRRPQTAVQRKRNPA